MKTALLNDPVHVDGGQGPKFPRRSDLDRHHYSLVFGPTGQNRPKLAEIRYMRNAKFGAKGLIFSPFYWNGNYMGVCRKNHQDPTNR